VTPRINSNANVFTPQLVSGLSNISNALNEFVRSYVQHTNKWVGTEASLATGVELAGMANLFNSSTAGATAPLTAAINAAVEGAVDKKGKKEKKPRKQKDPNAPKRPLTAYFLYTMSARPIVKQDFEDNGTVATAQDISNEILKRWNEMTEEEKNVSQHYSHKMTQTNVSQGLESYL
jgi:hypothetical protein